MQPHDASLHPEFGEEGVEDVGITGEGGPEVVRSVALATARKVRSQEPPLVRQLRHQVSELIGRAGITVRPESCQRPLTERGAGLDPVPLALAAARQTSFRPLGLSSGGQHGGDCSTGLGSRAGAS
jgi:hypothetical protein